MGYGRVVEKFNLGPSRLIVHCADGTFVSVPREGVDKSILEKLELGDRISVSEDAHSIYLASNRTCGPLYSRQT